MEKKIVVMVMEGIIWEGKERRRRTETRGCGRGELCPPLVFGDLTSCVGILFERLPNAGVGFLCSSYSLPSGLNVDAIYHVNLVISLFHTEFLKMTGKRVFV